VIASPACRPLRAAATPGCPSGSSHGVGLLLPAVAGQRLPRSSRSW
jgi:hypothetical protein